jgi:hypothetical protein
METLATSIEDADLVIEAVRGNTPDIWHLVNELAQSIEGELEADDAAAEEEAGDEDDEQPEHDL